MNNNHIEHRSNVPSDIRQYWKIMTFYERFEHIVALILTTLITVVILIALWHLIKEIGRAIVHESINPLENRAFQNIFGMIMTLLIAMEFKHSILKVLERNNHIIQVKTVILIALLAISRKFIIIDTEHLEANKIFALAFAALVLGIIYWLLHDKDFRALMQLNEKQNPPPTSF